jgi:hypothetical protein
VCGHVTPHRAVAIEIEPRHRAHIGGTSGSVSSALGAPPPARRCAGNPRRADKSAGVPRSLGRASRALSGGTRGKACRAHSGGTRGRASRVGSSTWASIAGKSPRS